MPEVITAHRPGSERGQAEFPAFFLGEPRALHPQDDELAVEVPGMSIPQVGCDDTGTNPFFSASTTMQTGGADRAPRSWSS